MLRQFHATYAKKGRNIPAMRNDEGVICITAETEETNIASQKVLTKAGLLPTGKYGEEGPLFICRNTD